MTSIPTPDRPTQPEQRERYAPVVRVLRASPTLRLIPCPRGGCGEHCATCELDCVYHDYLRQPEGSG